MDRAELNRLVGETGCADEAHGYTFLCDPHWSPAERIALTTLQQSAARLPAAAVDEGWLCIPTGGTTGGLRFARHDERTLTAAVDGFCAHFGITRVNAVSVLPSYHVSGLMARLRCAATEGQYLAWDWKRLEEGRCPELPGNGWVISLVPTQLQRLLASTQLVAWLRGFRVIFVGGGPVWPTLTDAAARAKLPISLSYGMTETAAMVAALRPEEFLAGARSSGKVMPHATITLTAEGVVRIAGESLFRGYFPHERTGTEFETEDLGQFDERGHLQILGRRDAVIITGGKKVQPVEVEATLRATGEFPDVAVIGVPDPLWGEAVVACYAAGGHPPDMAQVTTALQGLASHKRPKQFIPMAEWPRNAQGKLNRAALLAAIKSR